MGRLAGALLAIAGAIATTEVTLAQPPRAEYRAFWVDTFRTALNNHDEILTVVKDAKAANANAIFAEVRRRGDAWYLDSLEPLPDFTPIAPGYDPLQDLIDVAHAEGIEVHAFVIIGAIWNKNPRLPASPDEGPPLDPNHVFNHHGVNPETGKLVEGRANWLTRTLVPDGKGISFDGHRFGNEFWIDLGHPDAASYTLDVLMHLVRNYDIDGLHLDRIRYPELNARGQSPSLGASVGYNATSIARFQKKYGIRQGSPPPKQNDPRWSQWRRDQVTNFVRRTYLSVMAVKPQLRLSAATVAYGDAPYSEDSWSAAEAYWRVYQDWRAWTEEGIVDLVMPMVYKSDHTSAAKQFDHWSRWLRDHQYGRAGVMGIGAFVNSVDGSVRQAQRALERSEHGESILGVIFFSMAKSARGKTVTMRDFAKGLTSGETRNAIFREPAVVPPLPWKTSPVRGAIADFARKPDGKPVDSGEVTITSMSRREPVRKSITDGEGFFGAVDLEPGDYLIDVSLGGRSYYHCVMTVLPGAVAPHTEIIAARERSSAHAGTQ